MSKEYADFTADVQRTLTRFRKKLDNAKSMTKRFEGYFTGSNPEKADLFYQIWMPQNPVATLLITHGFAEHSDAYAEFAAWASQNHLNVVAWDLRGHGRSEGKRGFIADFELFPKELELFIQHLRKGPLNQSTEPLVLFGHSMGGLITLMYLLMAKNRLQQKPLPIEAAALSSPALGISMPVPKWKDQAAKVLLKLWPEFTLPNDIDHSQLTHIESRWRSYPRDPLRHDKASAPLYFGMQAAFKKVHESASEIKLPIFVQAAGQELIVSRPATEDFFPKIGSMIKSLKIYKDSYHEIFNDVECAQAQEDLKTFLDENVLKKELRP